MALWSEPVVAYPRKNLLYSFIVGNEKNEGGRGSILGQKYLKGNNKVNAYASRQVLKQ
jgi:hypothetical protein